jgi:hypothetical protein
VGKASSELMLGTVVSEWFRSSFSRTLAKIHTGSRQNCPTKPKFAWSDRGNFCWFFNCTTFVHWLVDGDRLGRITLGDME